MNWKVKICSIFNLILHSVVMDIMIKKEPEDDPLAIQSSDNTDTDEKKPLSEVPTPYLVVGDFNASHHSWGSNSDDDRGNKIAEEDFFDVDRVQQEPKVEISSEEDEVLTDSCRVRKWPVL
ncbi:uncharacterized protein [Periplaneta americana]|uniref:uncharacterized protein isoform X9 n=1 Tax=Periplaneta americana TaxID=6978 RepID=UPI0037E7A3A9